MARTVTDANLGSKEARRKLDFSSGKPHWREIGNGLHIGYRRGRKAGSANTAGLWLIRVYCGDRTYRSATVATADDAQSAVDAVPGFAELDKRTVLSFQQVQGVAWEVKREGLLELAAAEKAGTAFTVDRALDEYIEHLRRNGQQADDAENRASYHIRGALGERAVEALTTSEIRDWLVGVANIDDDDDDDKARRRKATANRTLTILKAALNFAWRHDKVKSDAAWRKVAPYRAVGAARVRYLQVAEVQRLVNAATGDFRDLLQGAIQTGARYSELAALRVSDVNFDVGTVHVRKSKSGKARDIILTEEGIGVFRRLAAGRSGDELLFMRDSVNGRVGWQKNDQQRPMMAAVAAASISPPITFHGLRHTWASLAVMAGVPLLVVADNLGHADTRMVERHYGHLAASYKRDAIRAAAPRFGISGDNVVTLERGRNA